MNHEGIIRLKNVGKTFREEEGSTTVALKDITLAIAPGEFFVFVGPSGCGKSTLLRMMSGLEKADQGTLEYSAGMDHRATSFIFQNFALLPWLTVQQNVEMGLWSRGGKTEKNSERVRAELKRLGLNQFADSYPRELSGGMKQRVGIARALVTDPKILFMDEPFSELDSFTAEELRKEVLSIWEERKMTIVMVTHIVEEALELADRVGIMTPRPGRVEKIVPIHLSRPRVERSQPFYDLEDTIIELVRP